MIIYGKFCVNLFKEIMILSFQNYVTQNNVEPSFDNYNRLKLYNGSKKFFSITRIGSAVYHLFLIETIRKVACSAFQVLKHPRQLGKINLREQFNWLKLPFYEWGIVFAHANVLFRREPTYGSYLFDKYSYRLDNFGVNPLRTDTKNSSVVEVD